MAYLTTRRRRAAPITSIAAIGAIVLAGCSSTSSGSPATSSGSSPVVAGSSPGASGGTLAGVCPSTVKIQTSWFPEPEKGAVYQLVGANGTVDKNKGTYSAIVDGVTISVLAGGPYLGNQSTIARMYQDPSILLGEVSTDDAILTSASQQVISVVAPLQKSPQAIIYDPASYKFTSIADVGKSNATILKAGEDAASDLLVASGAVKKSQLDYSYDGTPGRFVTSGGKDVFIEYASEVPYEYQHEITQWGKPLKSILLANAGYTTYENSLSVTPANKTKYNACLKALVPMIQKAIAAYAADPGPVDAAMIKYSQEIQSPTVLSTGLNDFSNQVMKQDGILANGADGTAGSFDTSRVADLITRLGPVAKSKNIALKSGLAPSGVVTNEYLDPSIKIAQ
jgi:hypothetical protein